MLRISIKDVEFSICSVESRNQSSPMIPVQKPFSPLSKRHFHNDFYFFNIYSALIKCLRGYLGKICVAIDRASLISRGTSWQIVIVVGLEYYH